MDWSKAAIRATYEVIAESFAGTRRHPWPEVLEFVADLPADSRVLDLGCGNGRHARAMIARGHRVIGLDFSRRLVSLGRAESLASARGRRIEWIEGDAAAVPCRDRSFDAATCVAVLHHLPTRDDRIAVLAEIRRVLRPGTRVFLSVWSADQPRFDAVRDSGDVEVPWTMPDGSVIPRFYHLFQEGELERLIIESGLRGERFFHGMDNWFAVARTHG